MRRNSRTYTTALNKLLMNRHNEWFVKVCSRCRLHARRSTSPLAPHKASNWVGLQSSCFVLALPGRLSPYTYLCRPTKNSLLWALAQFARLSKVSFKFLFSAHPPGKIVLSQFSDTQSQNQLLTFLLQLKYNICLGWKRLWEVPTEEAI